MATTMPGSAITLSLLRKTWDTLARCKPLLPTWIMNSKPGNTAGHSKTLQKLAKSSRFLAQFTDKIHSRLQTEILSPDFVKKWKLTPPPFWWDRQCFGASASEGFQVYEVQIRELPDDIYDRLKAQNKHFLLSHNFIFPPLRRHKKFERRR